MITYGRQRNDHYKDTGAYKNDWNVGINIKPVREILKPVHSYIVSKWPSYTISNRD